MLFNSYGFIFLFLPAVLLGAFACGRISQLAPVIFLALASLAFYAIGNWQFVPLLLGFDRVQLCDRIPSDRAQVAACGAPRGADRTASAAIS